MNRVGFHDLKDGPTRPRSGVDSERRQIDAITEMRREYPVHFGEIASGNRVEQPGLGEIFQSTHTSGGIEFAAV
jgi:hypothetical protein